MKINSVHTKFAVIAVLFSLVSAPVFAGVNQATATKITGEAEFQKAGAADWQKLEMGTILSEGDAVKTGVASEVMLTLTGAAKTAEISVRESSQFVFKMFQHDAAAIDTTVLDVSLGAVLVKAEKLAGASRFEVKTPTSIVGIRGTQFEVAVAK